MFRLLIMNNIRSLPIRPSVISSTEMRRRGCPLCNSHLVKNKSSKPDLSLYEGQNLFKRYNSNDLSLMSGVDLAHDSIFHNEDIVAMLEELEAIPDEPELIESLDSGMLTPTFEQAVVKTNKRKVITKANRELMAKIKTAELEKAGKERNLNHNLSSYLETCVKCGFLNRGLITLAYYLNKKTDVRVTSVDVFNTLMEGYSRIGNVDKVMEIWSLMEQEKIKPNVGSFASRLEAITKSTRIDKADFIKSTITFMENQGIKLNDLFNQCEWKRNCREEVLKAVKAIQPRYMPSITAPDLSYSSGLLKHLNSNKSDKLKSPSEGLFKGINPMKLFEEQLKLETKYYIDIKSVEKPVEENDLILKCRSKLDELNKAWGNSILDALERDLSSMAAMHKNMPFSSKQINIYPYLIVLDKNEYKDILLYEIRRLAEGSETFSPTVSQLYREIGNQVKMRYDKKMRFDDGVVDKVSKIYSDYINWYMDPSSSMCRNGRQQWQLLAYKNQQGPSIDREYSPWPYTVLYAIGKFLYKIILRDIKIDFNIFRTNQPPQLVPGFYPVYRHQGHINKEEVKPHPVLSRLFRAAHLPHLNYSVSELPMLTPPLPWSSLTCGGYIIAKTNIIRLPNQAVQQWERLKEANPTQLYPTYDALNQLASIPWRVNKKVLDVVIEVFNSGGNAKLDIPEPPSSCVLTDAPPLPIKSEKYLAYRQRMLLRRRKAEMYSLWCDALYRLSLANHFRDKIFWLPHNMDFRGRVYPCPPHLNHLGSDMARSLLTFALGKPLGPGGFDWLKIHLVNLTGLKKRDSVEDRLKFADEMIPEIMDSANNPLNGRKWWAESEEPWQTLACCIEIKKALECPDGVESYICHFPVHQDGSCNGLQHYAALGRDSAGAISVNLAPSHLPQDVYTCVCNIVERERGKDAMNGLNVAKVLEGFVKRKVIKQTVMTTVYGVTRFGARLQIAKQLKDIDDFPKEYVWQASNYLVAKTFASLREMFTSTREIQDWFTDSARLISQVCGQNVEYVTPLGLPVVQPYYKFKQIDHKKSSMGQVADNAPLDMFERPNVMKQKNAFPPNFIHSLDSTHMMLTSLHCEQEGITFVSVHDCYWTHPCNVPIMNKICREQFVALHSEPILKDLSEFLLNKYGYSEESLMGDVEAVAATKRKLNSLLSKVPPTGDFDLSNVLKSIYFFS